MSNKLFIAEVRSFFEQALYFQRGNWKLRLRFSGLRTVKRWDAYNTNLVANSSPHIVHSCYNYWLLFLIASSHGDEVTRPSACFSTENSYNLRSCTALKPIISRVVPTNIQYLVTNLPLLGMIVPTHVLHCEFQPTRGAWYILRSRGAIVRLL
jgi:hypothetical protein